MSTLHSTIAKLAAPIIAQEIYEHIKLDHRTGEASLQAILFDDDPVLSTAASPIVAQRTALRAHTYRAAITSITLQDLFAPDIVESWLLRLRPRLVSADHTSEEAASEPQEGGSETRALFPSLTRIIIHPKFLTDLATYNVLTAHLAGAEERGDSLAELLLLFVRSAKDPGKLRLEVGAQWQMDHDHVRARYMHTPASVSPSTSSLRPSFHRVWTRIESERNIGPLQNILAGIAQYALTFHSIAIIGALFSEQFPASEFPCPSGG